MRTAGSHALAQALASGPMARMRDVGDTSSQPNQSHRSSVSNEEWLLGRPAAARLRTLAATLLQEAESHHHPAPPPAMAPAGDTQEVPSTGGGGGDLKTKRNETVASEEPQAKRAKSEK